MKNLLFIVLLSAATCSAQTEFMYAAHESGPTGLLFPLGDISQNAYLSTGSAYFPLVLSSAAHVNQLAGTIDPSLSGLAIPLLTSITGSTSSQSVNIATTNGLAVVGYPMGLVAPTYVDYLLIGGGTSVQEVVVATSIVDSTHVMAIVRNSHAAGALVRKVFSSYSAFVQTQMGGGFSSLTNYGFIRSSALPDNVYDQYVVSAVSGSSCVYVQDDQIPWASTAGVTFPLVPQYSSGSVSGTGNPTNAVALIAGPITSAAPLAPCMQVQFLFTSALPASMAGTQYRYWWDE